MAESEISTSSPRVSGFDGGSDVEMFSVSNPMRTERIGVRDGISSDHEDNIRCPLRKLSSETHR